MNVLVEEKCLKDIANAIRKKGEVTTTYKPREMAVAIDNLQTGGSGCLVKIEQSDNQTITATYKGNTYTDEFFVLIGDSFQTSVKADKYYIAGTVNYDGKPLKGDVTVKATAATEAPKYRVTIEQSDNQTITATYDGKTYTNTFYACEGSRITFSIQADSNYDVGKLNFTEIIVKADVSVMATPAYISYKNLRFKIYNEHKYGGSDDEDSYVYCQFIGNSETFNIELFDRFNANRRRIEVTGNKALQQWLTRQENVAIWANPDYSSPSKVATFKKSSSTRDFDAGFFLNFSDGRELIFKPE